MKCKTIGHILLLFILAGCTTDNLKEEESLPIEQVLISNPIVFNLKTRALEFVPPYNSEEEAIGKTAKNVKWKTFEEEYGQVLYGQTVITDSTVMHTLIPLANSNKKLKSWLVGYYDVNGEITYRVRKIDKNKESSIDFSNKGTMVYDLSDTKSYFFKNANKVKSKGKHISKSSSGECYDEYRQVCSYYDANDNGVHDQGTDSDLDCRYYYVGENCNTDEVQFEDEEPSGGSGGGSGDWENPFGEPNGGPSNNGTCPEGYSKDAEGNCVKDKDPCGDIQAKNAEPNYSNRIYILKGKTGEKQETGYAQKWGGTYEQLPVSANGHAVGNPPADTMGFLHTHLNDYENGEFDKNGNPMMNRPVRIFSPKDLQTFLLMVKYASFHGKDVSKVYGTVVASTGIYTIRFTGNVDHIDLDFDPKSKELKKTFTTLTGKYGLARGFLKFMKNVTHNRGVSLYKVKNNGTVKEQKLDASEKLDPETCY